LGAVIPYQKSSRFHPNGVDTKSLQRPDAIQIRVCFLLFFFLLKKIHPVSFPPIYYRRNGANKRFAAPLFLLIISKMTTTAPTRRPVNTILILIRKSRFSLKWFMVFLLRFTVSSIIIPARSGQVGQGKSMVPSSFHRSCDFTIFYYHGA